MQDGTSVLWPGRLQLFKVHRDFRVVGCGNRLHLGNVFVWNFVFAQAEHDVTDIINIGPQSRSWDF